MNLINGFIYNLKGLMLSLKTPRLLILGLIRFVVVIAFFIAVAGLVFAFHDDIVNHFWSKPDGFWMVLLWQIVSLLFSLLLLGVSSIIAFIISQLIFSLFVMDLMSRITERIITGEVKLPEIDLPWWKTFFFLIKQELLRAIIPILILLTITVLGWLTPLGPVLTFITPVAAAIFLAWDNTDLIPARQLKPFNERFFFLRKTFTFHLGFGLWFLIPFVNILMLSFAPVGASLYFIEYNKSISS